MNSNATMFFGSLPAFNLDGSSQSQPYPSKNGPITAQLSFCPLKTCQKSLVNAKILILWRISCEITMWIRHSSVENYEKKIPQTWFAEASNSRILYFCQRQQFKVLEKVSATTETHLCEVRICADFPLEQFNNTPANQKAPSVSFWTNHKAPPFNAPVQLRQ